jgi:hypothetical protein
MNDPTETLRRKRIAELSSEAGDRKVLEERYGQVWTTAEMQEDFIPTGFMAPLIAVRRKSDGVVGSLEFQGRPRFYFNFVEDK